MSNLRIHSNEDMIERVCLSRGFRPLEDGAVEILGQAYDNELIMTELMSVPNMIHPRLVDNYEVTCKEEAKRSNSGAKTKTFEESTKTASIRRIQQGRYGISAPTHHKKRVLINSLYGVSTAYPYVILTAVTSVKDTY
ncbi:hypothetical protein Tco_0173558 [Tanacetum coccineum]